MKILNFGSLNLDYTYQVDHFVKAGETMSSLDRRLNVGGKGLNQSIALARAGAEAAHAGAVGRRDGGILLDALKDAGVDVRHVAQLDSCDSGNAFIQVETSGENCIVLYGGANQAIDEAMIDAVLRDYQEGDWIITQNEISNMPYLIRQAHAKGMRIILNPSPMNDNVWKMPLADVDLFLVNEEEAAALARQDADPLSALSKQYPHARIVMTLGTKGCRYWNGSKILENECYKVHAVDTTGAGDTFTGYFIACLAKGLEEADALRYASMASALSVTRHGASASIPVMEEVLRFEKSL